MDSCSAGATEGRDIGRKESIKDDTKDTRQTVDRGNLGPQTLSVHERTFVRTETNTKAILDWARPTGTQRVPQVRACAHAHHWSVSDQTPITALHTRAEC